MPLDVKKIEALTKLEPNNPKHWFYLGVYYISINDISQAYKALENAIKINPYFSQAQFLMGFVIIYNREFKTGLKYLEKAYTIDEEVFFKTKSDYEVEKVLEELIKGSIKVIQDQIELNPNNLENLYVMGRILFYIQNYESAINYFRKIIELKPDNWEVYIYLALCYKELKNYETAINYLKKSILINSYYAESFWLLGELYIDIGNYGLALKNLERAVELAPNNSRYLNSLAKVYLELDKVSQAIRTLQISIDTNPNSKWSYFYLGKALEKEFNFELAIEQYLKSLEIDPNFLEAQLSLAKLYSYINDYKKAIEVLESITDRLVDLEIYFMLGQFYYNIANYEKSIINLENYVKLINNNWQAFYLLYLDYFNLNDKEKALFYLEKAYELNPKDTKIITDLFKIYVDNKQIQKAEKFLNIIKNFVKDIELLKRIIFIYFDKKDYENAFSVFFENNLYNDLNYVLDLINFIKNKDRDIYLSFIHKILNSIDFNKNPEFYLVLQIDYINAIYETNTLQAYEYFNSKVGFSFLETLSNIKNYEDIINNRLNLALFNLFLLYLKIVFTLYAEYKSEDYLRKYMEIIKNLKMFDFLFIKEYDDLNINVNFISFILNSSLDIINNIILFYTLIFNFNYISLVLNFRDYILVKKNSIDFRNFVVIKVFEDIIPLLIENEINNIAMDFIDLFTENLTSFNYHAFLKYKIDILDLEDKSNQVLEIIEKYYSLFSYNSYIELIRIKNLINLGELKEIVKGELEKLVLEFNPWAMALYANIIIFEDKNEAFKLIDKAFDIIIENKFKFQYPYEEINTVIYLSKIYAKYYSIYKLVRYLNELSKKNYNNYRINYLLAHYLYLIEEFVDAEIVAKKLVKLAKTNNLLLEAQKLLATIKSERENYNKFLLILENNFKGITITISSYLNLIKKGKIDEVLKYLESIHDDTKIENVIIKSILYDKLEIYQHFIYYYNLFKIWVVDNNLDDLIDFIDKKLYNYSNLADFEELKLKAQINYSFLFKQKEHLQAIEEKKMSNLEQTQEATYINPNIHQQVELQNELDIKPIDNILPEDISNIKLNFDLLEKTLDNIQLDTDELSKELSTIELTKEKVETKGLEDNKELIEETNSLRGINEIVGEVKIQDNIQEINKEAIFDRSLIELFESESIDRNLLELYLSNIDKVKLESLDDIIIVNAFYIMYLLRLQERINLNEIIDKIDFNLFLVKRDEFIKQNLLLKDFFNCILDIELNIMDTRLLLQKLKELIARFKNEIYYFSFLLFILCLVYLNLNKIVDYKKYFQIVLNNLRDKNKNMFNFFNFLNDIITKALGDNIN